MHDGGTQMPKIDFLRPQSVFGHFFSLGRSLELVFGFVFSNFCMFVFGPLGEELLFAALLGPRLLLSVLISIHDPVL